MDKYRVVDGAGTMTVFEIYIKTTPERLWEAITDPEMRAKYSFGVQDHVGVDAGIGVPLCGPRSDRDRDGREPRGRPAAPARAELQRPVERQVKSAGTSRVTWEVEQVEDSCRLRVIHDQLPEDASGSCTAAGR